MRVHASETGLVLALALLVTGLMAAPVLRAPRSQIFGLEIVGRHHDPFTVMRQFTEPVAAGVYFQPVTDLPGKWLARLAGPVAAYNAIILLSFPLSALAAYWLARHLRIGRAAAGFAALAFAFSPFHIAQAAYHPQIAQTQWLPLYLLALWRCLDRATLARSTLLALAAVAVTWSNFYGGLIAGVLTPVAVAAYWYFVSRSEPRALRHIAVTCAVLLVIAVIGAAYAWQTARAAIETPAAFAFARADLFRYSATWWSYLVPPVASPVFGEFAQRVWMAAGVGDGLLENQVSLGWGVVALSAVAIALGRPRSDRPRIVLLLASIAAVALICSLSPEFRAGALTLTRPSAWFYGVAPMFRSYARFGVMVQLCAALLAGAGAEWLWRQGRVARRICVMALAMVAAEYAVWPPSMSRDVLPSMAQRWANDRTSRVRALDCAPVTISTASVPWLTRDRVVFSAGSLDDCAEPNFADKLAADGYTHMLVAPLTPEGRWLDSQPRAARPPVAARFADSAVFAVVTAAPKIYTSDFQSFSPREYDAVWTWRWMGADAGWTVRNTTAQPVVATVDIDMTSFHSPRRMRVLLDGVPAEALVVAPVRGVYRLGPFSFAPGAHSLTFQPIDAAVIADAILHNGDRRPLSFAIGTWRWSIEDGTS